MPSRLIKMVCLLLLHWAPMAISIFRSDKRSRSAAALVGPKDSLADYSLDELEAELERRKGLKEFKARSQDVASKLEKTNRGSVSEDDFKAINVKAEQLNNITIDKNALDTSFEAIRWPAKCREFFVGRCRISNMDKLRTWYEVRSMWELCCEAEFNPEKGNTCKSLSAHLFDRQDDGGPAKPDDDFCEPIAGLSRTHKTQISGPAALGDNDQRSRVAARLVSSLIDKTRAVPYPIDENFMGGALIALGLATAMVAPGGSLFEAKPSRAIVGAAVAVMSTQLESCLAKSKRVIKAGIQGAMTGAAVGAVTGGVKGALLGGLNGGVKGAKAAATAGAITGAKAESQKQARKAVVKELLNDDSNLLEGSSALPHPPTYTDMESRIIKNETLFHQDVLASLSNESGQVSMMELAKRTGVPPLLYFENSDNCWSYKTLGSVAGLNQCLCYSSYWYPFAFKDTLYKVIKDTHDAQHAYETNDHGIGDNSKAGPEWEWPHYDVQSHHFQDGSFDAKWTSKSNEIKNLVTLQNLLPGYADWNDTDFCYDFFLSHSAFGYVPWQVHGRVGEANQKSQTPGRENQRQAFLNLISWLQLGWGDEYEQKNVEGFYELYGFLLYKGATNQDI